MTKTSLPANVLLPPCDVLIVTALPEEFSAVLEVQDGAVPGSEWIEHQSSHGLLLKIREYQCDGGGSLRVAVVEAAGMGQAAASNAALPLLRDLRVHCLAMCGVCAGWRGRVNLGDVIVGNRLWTYDTGKIERVKKGDQEEEKFYADITTYNLDPRWAQRADPNHFIIPQGDWLQGRPLSFEAQEDWLLLALLSDEDPSEHREREKKCPNWAQVVAQLWSRGDLVENELLLSEQGRTRAKKYKILHGKLKSPEPFRVHLGPLGTGSSVVEDRSIFPRLKLLQRKVLGLEMEAASIGMMAEIQGIPHQIVMKAVMDYADGEKNDIFKLFASRASAECLLAFLRKHLAPRGTEPFPDEVLIKGTSTLPSTLPKPSDLLRADYGVMSFYGREDLLNELEIWRKHQDPVRIQLLHASGGMGKTRLMIEWTRQVREAGENWTAGFLREPVREGWFSRLSSLDHPMLIIIDYAERWANLHHVLEPLVKHSQSGRKLPIRVVLLARNGDKWWDDLKQRDAILGALLERNSPMRLKSIATKSEQRREIFSRACLIFGSILGKPAPTTPPVPLDGPMFERALYILMAALVAVEGWPSASLSWKGALSSDMPQADGEKLMSAILDHEQRFWRPSQPLATEQQGTFWQEAAQKIVSAATLLDGLDQPRCEALATRILKNQEMDQFRFSILRHLHQLYGYEEGSRSHYISPLLPDLLGEAMVERTLNRASVHDEYLKMVFEGEIPSGIIHGLEILGALSEHNPRSIQWAKLTLHPLLERAPLALIAAKRLGTRTAFGKLGALMLEQIQQAPPETQAKVADLLENEGFPGQTVGLSPLAQWVGDIRSLGENVQASSVEQKLPPLVKQAERLRVAGNRAAGAGQTQQAINLLQNALALHLSMAKQTDFYLPILAEIHLDLSSAMGKGGQSEAALSNAIEAVNFFAKFAEHSDIYLPHLALGLGNSSCFLSDLGRYEEALPPIQKALEIFQGLEDKKPGKFTLNLAFCYNNLALRLVDIENYSEALAPAREAVNLKKKLAGENPDSFLPDLLRSLNNLVMILIAIGNFDEALKPARDSAELGRTLFIANSDSFRPDLAKGLLHLALVCSECGLSEEALLVAQEADDHVLHLQRTDPDSFSNLFATYKQNMAKVFDACGKKQEALDFATEVVATWRMLSTRYPQKHLPNLATSLLNLAMFESSGGKSLTALQSCLEALDIIWPFFEKNRARYSQLVGTMLKISHELMKEIGQIPDNSWRERLHNFFSTS